MQSVLADPQGAVVSAAATAILPKGRFSLSWKDCVLLVGLVATITELVLAILGSYFIFVTASLIATGVLLFSLYEVHFYGDALDFQKALQDVGQREKELLKANQAFQEQIVSLEEERQKWGGVEAQLRTQNDALAQRAAELEKQDQKISFQTQETKENAALIGEQDQELKEGVKELSCVVDALSGQQAKQEEQEQRLLQEVNETAEKTGENLEQFGTVASGFKSDADRLCQGAEAVREGFEQVETLFSKSGQEVQANAEKIKQAALQLAHLEEQLQARAGELGQVEEELKQRKTLAAQLGEIQAGLDKKLQEFLGVQRLLEEKEEKLTSLEARVQQTAAKAEALEVAREAEVKQVQAEQEALLQEGGQKIARMLEQIKGLKAELGTLQAQVKAHEPIRKE